MADNVTLDEISPANRRLVGSVMIALGCGLAILIANRPDSAKIPLFVLWLVCATFVLSGLAVAVYSRRNPGRYRWAITGALACMSAAPTWIAFGPGARSCTSSFGLLNSELPCRGAFGFGAVILILMFVIALRQAIASKNAA